MQSMAYPLSMRPSLSSYRVSYPSLICVAADIDLLRQTHDGLPHALHDVPQRELVRLNIISF